MKHKSTLSPIIYLLIIYRNIKSIISVMVYLNGSECQNGVMTCKYTIEDIVPVEKAKK